ncbi:MAG TPA: flagellar motor stator protein MotA [candidate division Zixibacteria bacterium]|nr:flagellar motor stator protein MotA [candidate division Zixibacteria bacterium]
MFTILGFGIVLSAVIGGFVLEGGPIAVLNQTIEFLIIGGAAVGSVVAGTPTKTLRALAGNVKAAVTGSGHSRADYVELFAMLYEVFSVMRKSGGIALEKDVDAPDASEIFKKYPRFMKNHAARNMLFDTLRLVISGSTNPEELSHLMDEEIYTHEEEGRMPASVLTKTGDSLPGLGIVAAVLGVIIAMGSMDQGPEVIGHKIAAALVGTFLGILLCYGIVQPLVQKMELLLVDRTRYLECIKTGVLAYLNGAAPIIAVEHARRAVFSSERPSALELEEICRGRKE